MWTTLYRKLYSTVTFFVHIGSRVFTLHCVLLLICESSHVVSDNKGAKMKGLNMSMTSFVENILSRPGYDKFSRPGLDLDTATTVYVDLFFNSISSMNEIDMEYTVNLYVRQTWRDFRLAFTETNRTVTLNYNQLSRIWVPDLFFRNEKRAVNHDVTVPNRLLRLSPDGTVLYSQRISMVMDCQMLLEKFPLDNQTCKINIGSYGYTRDEMDFVWNPFKQSLRLKNGLSLPEFKIEDVTNISCGAAFSTGSFACLEAIMHIKRQFSYYLLQVYVPSVLVVTLSWVSFWIDIDAVPARISLGLLTILTMTTQASAISERLPRVSYVKAIDVWMATCLVFVFGGLVEYSAVNVLHRKQKGRGLRNYFDTPSEEGSTVSLPCSKSPDEKKGPHRGPEEIKLLNMPESDLGCESENEIGAGVVRRTVSGPQSQSLENNDEKHYQNTTQTKIRLQRDRTCLARFRFNIKKWKSNQALFVDVASRAGFPAAFIIFNVVYWIYYVWII